MTPKRVFLIGATGTIGRAAAAALVARGHQVICFVRPGSTLSIAGAQIRYGTVTDPASLETDGLRGEKFDALVSCLASKTGTPRDAWAIDYTANLDALQACQRAGASQMVLLSAICVQRPKLAFQQAKLALESQLIGSGLTYSIIRPTAFFKSLSGQIERLRQGKPFLLFGSGALTSCKPISDGDLAEYMANCLVTPALQNRILPIGGPGPAITPRQQGAELFRLLGLTPKYRSVPLGVLNTIAIAPLDIAKLLSLRFARQSSCLTAESGDITQPNPCLRF
ncbi:MAG: NAD(P)H-binding protein [Cypionkella sp.]|nr:NAD(P)H-binding protein [Cypionkella sp.]